MWGCGGGGGGGGLGVGGGRGEEGAVIPRVAPPRGENEQGDNINKQCNFGARKREGISLLKSLDLRFEYPCSEILEESCYAI